MSIWIVVWIVISVILALFLGWTFIILIQQKSAWKAFAAKHKLRYKPRAMMQAPEMDGVIDEYKFNFFSSEHVSYDVRGSRNLTAIEITLSSTMPVDGAIASGGMVPLVKSLEFKAEIRPEHKDWNKSYIASTNNKAVLEVYLDEDRLQALTKVMNIKNAWVIFIFRKNAMLLRIDLPDPITSVSKLENIKTIMLKTAQTLELKKGESKRLKSEETRSTAKDIALEVDDKDMEKGASLQLEDEVVDKKEDELSEETPDQNQPSKEEAGAEETVKNPSKNPSKKSLKKPAKKE